MAEPPSCPLALDMSLRDSSYSVASGPCVVARLPSEDVGRLADPQSRDHGFLRTKMKVCGHAASAGQGRVCSLVRSSGDMAPMRPGQRVALNLGPGFCREVNLAKAQMGGELEKKRSGSKVKMSCMGQEQ